MEEMRANNPQMGTIEDFENWLAPKVEAYKRNPSSRAVTTIPIIFHVIHNGDAVGSGENLSATLVNAQIDQLNNDFRRILGTSGYNTDSRGADSEIEFCAATVDPNGNTLSEPGIDRIQTTTSSYSRNAIEALKPSTIWNPDDYCNVWVCQLSGGLLGYAQFPSNSGLGGLSSNGGSANTDGVVVLASSVGSSATPNPAGGVYDEGRTLTHEIGHWLGLRHIWGDANCGTDYCNDTPTAQGPASGCPNKTTCDGQRDMVENYMDYSYDNCMNIFTNDQKARMQAVLANSLRRDFSTSNGCGSGGGGGGGGGATCTSTITSFPYAEGFEGTLGAWTQGSGDDFDWALRQGTTPSSNTGPNGASEGSSYIYVEASSPNYPSKVTILNSPCFDLTSASQATVEFQFHATGNSVGETVLQASTDNGSSWTNVWSLSGDQGANWNAQSVNLNSYAGETVSLRFVATTNTSWQGDMCVDDFSLSTSGGGGGGGGGGCNDTEVVVTINTDNYGSETTWTLLNSSGGTVGSGGPYANNSSFTETFCLPDDCYEFTINDSYGDGICCSFGNGSYSVTADGATVASGGDFGSSEVTEFSTGSASCNSGPPACPSIDFNAYTINSYSNQDNNGANSIGNGGASLTLTNNTWKHINFSYNVTANTIVEFDFSSTNQGEIHGIGFDNDNSLSSNFMFKVHGTQNWGLTNYDNYSGGTTTYTIPVGNFYTGTFDRLVFINDNDAGSNNNSVFTNVKVYEGGSCTARTIVDMTPQPLKMGDEAEVDIKLDVYPSPMGNMMYTRLSAPEGEYTGVLYDLSGRIIWQGTVPTYEMGHDVSNLPAGAYFLKVTLSDSQILTQKVMKSK